jgi:hypothetical protein
MNVTTRFFEAYWEPTVCNNRPASATAPLRNMVYLWFPTASVLKSTVATLKTTSVGDVVVTAVSIPTLVHVVEDIVSKVDVMEVSIVYIAGMTMPIIWRGIFVELNDAVPMAVIA